MIPEHIQLELGRYIAGCIETQAEAEFVEGLMHYVAGITEGCEIRFVKSDAEKLTGDRWEIVLETATPSTRREETILKRRLAEMGAFIFGASRAYRKLQGLDSIHLTAREGKGE